MTYFRVEPGTCPAVIQTPIPGQRPFTPAEELAYIASGANAVAVPVSGSVPAVAVVANPYEMSANLTQTAIAFIEAMMFFDGRVTKNLAFAGAIFLSTFVPPTGVFGYWGANEKLWETIIAVLLSALIVTPIWDGGVGKNMVKGFVLSTSSMAATDELYTLFITAGQNNNYLSYRANYPAATTTNRAFLG